MADSPHPYAPLLARLEAILASHTYQGNNKIRYPLTLPQRRGRLKAITPEGEIELDDGKLRGRVYLDPAELGYETVESAHWDFGRVRVNVFQALVEVLEHLEEASGGEIYWEIVCEQLLEENED